MDKKTRSRGLTAVILAVVLCVTGFLVYRRWEATFTPEKWLAATPPSSRRLGMLDDLLSKHPVTGLTQAQVETLLGQATPGGGSTLLYYLGTNKDDGAVTYWYLFLEDGLVRQYRTVLMGPGTEERSSP